MRLGAFVIHGNNSETLPACLDSLSAVADEVVAVDSGSTDGSAELVAKAGIRSVSHAWQGYGSARAAAVRELGSCDWLLYLDADERLEPEARRTISAWKQAGSTAGAHVLPVRDWAELPSGRFLYRTHHRTRLVRRDAATWSAQMIVHETVGQKGAPGLDAFIEHRFAADVGAREEKEEHYALLWAIRAHAAGRRGKLLWLQRPALFFRDAVIKGAAFRGGLAGMRLAWAVAAYHARKYQRLSELREGKHPDLVDAFNRGEYARVFQLATQERSRAAADGSPRAASPHRAS